MSRTFPRPLLLGVTLFLLVGLAFGHVILKAQARETPARVRAAAVATERHDLGSEFVKAAAMGDVSRLKSLLAQGANVNSVSRGEYDGRDCVVEDGVDALSVASETPGHLKVVKFLIAHGAAVNNGRSSSEALGQALECGDTSVVRFLIERGAFVDDTTPGDVTPLMQAAWSSNSTATDVDLLLAAGARPNVIASDGNTALSKASNAHKLKELLSHGATARGRYGRKALWNGTIGNDVAGVRLLLRAGAEVDARDEQGQTALMMACSRLYEESGPPPGPLPDMVGLLLAHHANVLAKDKRGETAMAHIKSNPLEPEGDPDGRKRDMAAIRLLKQAGARE